MLSKAAIHGAYPLAQILARSGQTLSVVEGSPLASAIAACQDLPIEVDGEAVVTGPIETRLLEASERVDPATGKSDHEAAVAEVVDLASKAVQYTMDLARNVVTPKVRKLVEDVEAMVESHQLAKLQPMEVKPEFLAPIYQSPELREWASQYAKEPAHTFEPVRLTAQWNDQALVSGNPSLDTLAQKSLADKGEAVKSLWERYFSNKPGQYRSAEIRDDIKSLDDALVLFLGANRLIESDEVPEGLPVNLADYRSYLGKIRGLSGALLTNKINTTDLETKSRRLVLEAPADNNGTIRVNGEVYNQWLAEGGSPEALYGAVTQGGTLSYDTMLSKSKELAAEWERVRNIQASKSKFELQAILIRGLREGLVNIAKELQSENATFDASVYAMIDERLTHFHLKDIDELYIVARKAVCRIFYPHTDAERILNAVDSVKQDKPELNEREAAFLVMLDYVTDWLGDAITVSKQTESVAA